MAEKVLVVTPYMALGRLIRQSLEQSSAYEVQVAETGEEALVLCTQIPFSVAILDADVADQSVVSLGQAMQSAYPTLRLVIIPPNNDPTSSLLDGLSPNAFLSKPFYLPDLLQTIESLLSDNTGQPEGDLSQQEAPFSSPLNGEALAQSNAGQWYEDPIQTFDHLACLSLGPGVHEAIITCKGELWASLGQLSAEAARELATITIQHWEEEEASDLARFVNLKANGSQYFLYATHLPGNLVLSLAYDSNMPFSRIRVQTNQLVRSLVNTSPDNVEAGRPSRSAAAVPDQPTAAEPATEPAEEETLPDLTESTPLFYDIPSSVVPLFQDISQSGWVKENEDETISSQAGFESRSFEDTLQPAEDGSLDQEPVEPVDEIFPGQEIDHPTGASIPEPFGQDKVQPAITDQPTRAEKMDVFFSTHAEAGFELFKTVVPNLAYTTVLIPRLPQHLLKDRLSVKLKQWMPQISLAFGWYLESLSIDPDYLEWIVRLSPEVAPAKMVENIRQHTSQHILAAFAGLAQDNPSGDFWAPDYILACGSGQIPPEVVREFITLVRKHQTVAEF